MAKKELKQQNKDLEIHVIDLIAKIDPSNRGKYTKFLTKILKKYLKDEKIENEKELYERKVHENHNDIDDGFVTPKVESALESVLVDYLCNYVFNYENLDNLVLFHKHVEEKRIIGQDINSYNSWDEIQKQVSIASLKQVEKLLEKEVQKVYESSDWLVVKPLTFESSLSYGAGTRWCTASRTNKEYFYRYSNNGVLYYVISKVTGDKYGLYYDIDHSEFSIWDASDKRVDSVQTKITMDLMTLLYQTMIREKHNYFYFSEDEKNKSNRFWGGNLAVEPAFDIPIREGLPIVTEQEPNF